MHNSSKDCSTFKSSNLSSALIGVGGYLPSYVMSNEELSSLVDTNNEWIVSRTGIKQRHIVKNEELTSDMAFKAAELAIKNSNINLEDLDLIIVCTTSPDRSFPSVAVSVQAKLGIKKHIPAFDIQAVCSGFIYGLHIADNFIKAGSAKTILLIGADSMSKLLDWQDRNTCVLFGDGAGAVIVQAATNSDSGIIASQINADGAYESILHTDGGISLNNSTGKVKMLGKEVFKHAVEKMSQSIIDLLDKTNFTKDQLDWIVPHQANIRIIESIASRLSFPMSKIATTVDMHANTSAATIPLALDHLARKKALIPGNLIMLTALGGGLTWGACLLKW
jgi:3-oxoacyl-[acyl-carrier-protein] synthase III